MRSFNIKILNNKGVFLKGSIEEINMKDSNGKFAIMCNHESRTVFILPSKGYIRQEGEKKDFFISYGIVNIDENGEVLITCEACEWKNDIDVERAKSARDRAMKRIEEKDGVDVLRAERALQRAIGRIESVV